MSECCNCNFYDQGSFVAQRMCAMCRNGDRFEQAPTQEEMDARQAMINSAAWEMAKIQNMQGLSKPDNVLQFKLAKRGGNSANAAEFLRELADLCDQVKIETLALFYSDPDDERRFHFHRLLGAQADVIYIMEAAKVEWLQGATS